MAHLRLSRRTLLRGAGAAISLPLLEAMMPASADAAARAADAALGVKPGAPVRMAFIFMPNGVNAPKWAPIGRGRDFQLSPTLAPLQKFRNDLLVFSQLMNAGSLGGDGHYVKTAGLLTGTTITKTTGKDLRCGGVSFDQLAAQRIGHLTALPSLELGIEPVIPAVDTNVGYTQLYGCHIAWSTPTTPAGKEINPLLAFNRLFRSNAGSAQLAADHRSVLDLVSDDARTLRQQVGHADQQKLDDYLESIRAVEKRIDFNNRQRAEHRKLSPEQLTAVESLESRILEHVNDPDRKKNAANRPADNHTEHCRLMLDLMVLAFWSDTTRISTFMFGNAVSGRNFSFLDGVSGGHHQISHHKNDPAQLDMYQRINQWHVAQYAYMLERMASIREGDGTLLDNSMILFGSSFRDGNAHDPHDLPLLMAGRGGNTLATGRHLQFKKDTPLCNLYAALLDRAGAPVDHFGDSTEKLPGLADPDYSGNAPTNA